MIGRALSYNRKNVIYVLQYDKEYCKLQYNGMTAKFIDSIYQHLIYVRNNIKTTTSGARFNLPGYGRKNKKISQIN